MSNGKVKNFLEGENSPTSRKIQQLEKEVKFHAKLANNYLERLNSLEAELENKDSELAELQATIQQLEKNKVKLLAEKDNQIATLTNELHNTNQNYHLLTNCGGNLLTKRQNFIQILTANLPADRIQTELGDIYHG